MTAALKYTTEAETQLIKAAYNPERPKRYAAWAVLTGTNVEDIQTFYESTADCYIHWRLGYTTFAQRRKFFTADRRKIKWTAAAYWEALAAEGVIPLDWVGNPDRLFMNGCQKCNGRGEVHVASRVLTHVEANQVARSIGSSHARPIGSGSRTTHRFYRLCAYCDGSTHGPYPKTLEECLTFASSPAGMLAVEERWRTIRYKHRFPTKKIVWETRPSDLCPLGVWRGLVIDEARHGPTPQNYLDARRDILLLGYDVIFHDGPNSTTLFAPPAA